MSRRTTQSSLLRWSTCWCAIVFIVFSTVFMAAFSTASLNSYKRVMELEMATLLGQGVDQLATQTVTTSWDRYVAVTDSVIRLTDNGGNVLFQINSPVFNSDVVQQIANRVPPQPQGQAFSKLQWSYPYKWRDASGFHRVIALTEGVHFENGASGVLAIYSLTDPLRQDTLHMLTIFVVMDLAVVALFAGGMYVLLRRGFQPLQRLMAGIQQVEWRRAGRLRFEQLPPELASLQQSINQLLDRIDDAVDEQRRFMADASHELRTPLAIVAGHANLLRRWGSKNARVWEPAVRNIVLEVERLQKLVDQLLTMSRLEEEKLPPVTEGIDQRGLEELFVRLSEDAAVLRPDLDMEAHVHLTPGARVAIERDRLRQVLVGLIDNAIRHTREGGWLLLAAREEGPMVRVSVSDNGEGIPADVLPHIFERFYRGDAARATGKGSGLGLAISKQLIEAYQGKIYVRSREGRGTTVIILLPTLRPMHMRDERSEE
ncbi:signal transduction histidine kinase [Alicyclobacillus sacchari]|uniref:histidine kinase n=1 Tax=Alicyclobacillus sacchari TaxID=392010 RepID=A0A4R8LWM9_9BACL|nr:HAMP domain-containing sensor histidine kinase [Alicyclobacillus sacchari]TDY51217.1 signal transduction histidine kinase [Alicyclobacillus sacchari]